MKKFAIFKGALSPNATNIVSEVHDEITVIGGVEYPLRERFHSSLIATMRQCPEGTQPGDEYDVIAGSYSTPMATMDTDTGNGEPPPKGGDGG